MFVQAVAPIVEPDGEGDSEDDDEDFDQHFLQLLKPVLFRIFNRLVSGFDVFDDLVFCHAGQLWFGCLPVGAGSGMVHGMGLAGSGQI
jgi:hypothetical protein